MTIAVTKVNVHNYQHGGDSNEYSFLEIANNFSFIDGTITPSDYRYPTTNTFVSDMAEIVPLITSSPGILVIHSLETTIETTSIPLLSPVSFSIDHYICIAKGSFLIQIDPFSDPGHMSDKYVPPYTMIIQLYIPSYTSSTNSTSIMITNSIMSMHNQYIDSTTMYESKDTGILSFHDTGSSIAAVLVYSEYDTTKYSWNQFDHLKVNFNNGTPRSPFYATMTVMYEKKA